MLNYTYTHKCVSPNTWEGAVRKSMMMGWDPDARKQVLEWMAWAGPQAGLGVGHPGAGGGPGVPLLPGQSF